MDGPKADDSVVLNTSRDSDDASGTDDERLERRMRRAVLDPTYMDGTFSDDENSRVLRSSRRKEADHEPAAMETETAPPAAEAAVSGNGGEAESGDGQVVIPENIIVNPPEMPDITVPVKNTIKKVEINYLKAGDQANPSGAQHGHAAKP
jgi:hypothetical protein